MHSRHTNVSWHYQVSHKCTQISRPNRFWVSECRFPNKISQSWKILFVRLLILTIDQTRNNVFMVSFTYSYALGFRKIIAIIITWTKTLQPKLANPDHRISSAAAVARSCRSNLIGQNVGRGNDPRQSVVSTRKHRACPFSSRFDQYLPCI